MSKALAADIVLRDQLARRQITATLGQTRQLRRIALTLHRWGELECGDGNDAASWCIERNEETGKPLLRLTHCTGVSTLTPVPDRERGALRRLAVLCQELGAQYYHQTDPRGAEVYLSRDPMTDQNYSNGIPI